MLKDFQYCINRYKGRDIKTEKYYPNISIF
jgi:hypothetical protein